ncbi:hypothetical protein NBRC116594_14350 [Shimia sp. NS0008-38b]|uniref:putative quinol monooxygenase n=1 Tax=Shimia sp. NS0008-38b TaxID=3127653 RepID=UPI00310280F5
MPVTVLLTFVATVDDPSHLRETLTELAQVSQKMTGALRYSLYQGQDDPNYFHIHQYWANREAYQAYINSNELNAAFVEIKGLVSELLVKELTPVANAENKPILIAC